MTKLRLIAAAIAIAAPVAFAQTSTGTPQKDTTQPPTHPTQQGGATGGTGSPSTPPTHPTERSTPSTTVPNTTGTPKPGDASGSAEAQQVCKNLTGAQERKDCMAKAERERGSTSGGSTSGGSTSTR